ncbi:hypothetical protein LOC67_03375 [Stieleria sp. JC731]|uniref:hypothetical protein n=1 Tax=Pirellulaceae TaxID=2691357 RepID=UPI001E568DAD|nr:hypothetical protein [Stieleria sp. JC731]MCC9599589.1 hypothetical protein [Stieleria sp. JC731]
MPDYPADRLISLNQHAIEVLKLGIPLDFGFGDSSIDQLIQINTQLIPLAGRDLELGAFLSESNLPSRYRSIAEALLVTRNPASVFESLAIEPRAAKESALPLRVAMVEPIVVMSLSFFVLIILSSITTPTIVAQHRQLGSQPGSVTELLILIMETRAVWVLGFPALLIIGWIAWRKSTKAIANRLPGATDHRKLLQKQSNAQRILALVDSGIDQELAQRLVDSQAAGDPMIKQLFDRENSNSVAYRRNSLTRTVRMYGFLAQYTRNFKMMRLPQIVGLSLASLIVLGISLLLFVPWIDTFYSISAYPVESFQTPLSATTNHSPSPTAIEATP